MGLAPFIDTISRTLYPVILLLVNRLPHSSLVGIVMQCATSHKVSPFRIGMALARKFVELVQIVYLEEDRSVGSLYKKCVVP